MNKIKVQLTKTQSNKFAHNVLVFLAPLGILYLSTIIGTVSQPFHNFSFMDFVPGQVAQGGLILYVLNAIMDFLRKISANQ